MYVHMYVCIAQPLGLVPRLGETHYGAGLPPMPPNPSHSHHTTHRLSFSTSFSEARGVRACVFFRVFSGKKGSVEAKRKRVSE